jgi:hypothetical protein
MRLLNFKRLLAVLALGLFASAGHAQQVINCATSTPCVNNGPTNTGTGDQLPTAGTKINANFAALPSELFSGSPLSVVHGGTGTSTPTVTAGTNVTITGTWPNLTINSSGGGGGTPGGSSFSVQYNNSGAFGGLLPGSPGTYCLVWSSISAAPTIGSCPGAGGGAAFSALTSGTNTAMAGLCGTGCSIAATGSGTIGATSVTGFSPASGKTLTANNSITLAGTDGTTMTFPATSGTVDTLNSAQTFAAAKTFPNSDILLLGSSTGATTLASANASATNYTATYPANTGTLAELDLAQTWSATQTLSGLTLSGITGSTQCLTVNTSGVVSGTGSACGSGGGAVSSVSAGSSGLISSTPTTGAVVVDVASVAANTVYANLTGSSATPTAATMTALQSALVTANAQLCAATAPTGPTNDYSPTCSSGSYGTTTAVLYFTPTSGGSTIDGLVAGSAMQQILIINAEAAGGSDSILLINQSSSDSTAANRFLASGNLVIPAGGRVDCVYLASTVTRWQCH